MGITVTLALIVSGPLIFDYWWTKRWFRVCWWGGLLFIGAQFFRL